eukprot:1145631-Pelagomonas_calceolata.AAC.16
MQPLKKQPKLCTWGGRSGSGLDMVRGKQNSTRTAGGESRSHRKSTRKEIWGNIMTLSFYAGDDMTLASSRPPRKGYPNLWNLTLSAGTFLAIAGSLGRVMWQHLMLPSHNGDIVFQLLHHAVQSSFKTTKPVVAS